MPALPRRRANGYARLAQLVRVMLLEAELVAFGVGHDDPVLAEPLVVAQAGGAEGDEPIYSGGDTVLALGGGGSVAATDVDVEMHAVLDALGLGHLLEEEAGTDA